ncbi:Crp/Fnr family transcriptional regulator [Flavihumibacter petaseus]|uniref:Cyclic nucleotide-binding domain-containing protein n=1 Tax=Flavihumibacter petaseus NBRC 106054 TaxID=1220578 RepID=A0A0E9N532_9BACT|nr:Crp/Fnr family transcriptional regulator [Flavihumibacter petaseus]GAO44929.1 hypothetical protein FPE01S_04_01720 [Flavihumibacter petaseus NBRC 106054]
MKSLLEHISRFVALDNYETDKLSHFGKLLLLKKKDFLWKEGQICRAQYFVIKGCLRLYYLNEKGQEQITQFAIENWWIADIRSLDMRQPSVFHLQAVENSEVLSLDIDSMNQLLEAVPRLEKYFRLVQQRAYGATQQRLRFLHSLSKEEQYRQFIQAFPGFTERIPQYMLASYLGFTPEYLSELRKKHAASIS